MILGGHNMRRAAGGVPAGGGGGNLVAEILADSPELFYILDDLVGSPQDSSGNDRHATVYGTIVQGSTELIPGYPSTFTGSESPGTGSFRSTEDKILYGSAKFTYETIWKPSFDGWNYLCGYIGTVGTYTGILCVCRTGRILQTTIYHNGSSSYIQTASGVVTIGDSHHVVFVAGRDSANDIEMWVDGSLVKKADQTKGARWQWATSVYPNFGRTRQADPVQSGGHNSMDALYSSCLTPERIAAHFAATGL